MLQLAFNIQVSASEVDIIHPQQGQFANYYIRYYGPSPGVGWWNTSYNEYVQPHLINTTQIQFIEAPYGKGTYWCTVDTTNRLVTDTDPNFWWKQSWYVFWIETDVVVGSTINWSTTTATIVGNEILNIAGQDIDCWIANGSYYIDRYDLFYYDKVSGVAVADQMFSHGELDVHLILNDTNVPIGEKTEQIIRATINANPNTLNLRSRGKWVTAYIEFTEGFDVNGINVSSIRLEDTIAPEPKPIAIGDYDEDGIPDLMIKFNRAEVEACIRRKIYMFQLVGIKYIRMIILLTITGCLNDGTPFEGTDEITIFWKMPRWMRLELLGTFPT